MEKILLDTDIGTDIDDAVCLAYLLANPECELMGITTVSGDIDKRSQLASALVYQAGKDIPIFPGMSRPTYGMTTPLEVIQYKAIDKWKHSIRFPKGEWMEFMKDTIEKNPGEITLLAIGPMSNVGYLLSVYPELAPKLKRIELMCGAFTDRFKHIAPIEFNARSDPFATAMVYDAKTSIHKSVGLDVTCQVAMSSKKAKECFKHPLLEPVLDYAGAWFEWSDEILFHDPLAAIDIFYDDVVTFAKGDVSVEIKEQEMLGTTRFAANEQGAHQIAETVNPQKFFEYYFSVFGITEF